MVPARFDIQPAADWLKFRATEKQAFYVAIDGPGGSGKSTLAEELSKAIDATVIHGDDFYRVMDPDERAALTPPEAHDQHFDWQRWREQVLEPLSEGVPACYQIYDWTRNVLADWVRVEPRGIVLIEGVTSCRAELREYYDLMIYVQAPHDVCQQRCRARDHGWTEAQFQRWAEAEHWYAANVLDLSGVDFVYCGQTGAILRHP